MNSNERAIFGIIFVLAMILPLFFWMNSQLVNQGGQANATGLATYLGTFGPYMLIFVLVSGIMAGIWYIYKGVT